MTEDRGQTTENPSSLSELRRGTQRTEDRIQNTKTKRL
ncbi:hypothetical protein D1AOALGA4SA_6242 [Olavius algarvensis Delta 1 endosymbiont]|nr:hypothetical protein D1AOALGA4SA_6242 [Olavius algarvensis Delta 1 endosymbiont]